MSILVAKVNGPNKGWNDDEFTTIEEDFMKSDGIGDDSGTGQDLEVVEDAPASLNVIVDEGVCYVRTTRSGRSWYIRVKVDSAETVAIAQNLSGNDRIDALIVRVSASVIPDATASNVATLEIVEGAPAVGPSAPSDGDIQTAIGSDAFYRIADVEVDNGVGQIFDADIDDQRAGLNFGFNNSPIYTTFYGNGNNLDGVVHSPVDEHLLADGNGTRNLGATGTRWKDLWLSGDITATGDVVANSFAGDGSGITGITSDRDYGDGSDGALSVTLGSEEDKEDNSTNGSADMNLGYMSWHNDQSSGYFTFEATESILATKIHLWFKRTGAPAGNVDVDIRRVARNSDFTKDLYRIGLEALPDRFGPSIGSATIAENTFTTGYVEYTLTLSASTFLKKGEIYVVDISVDRVASDSNYSACQISSNVIANNNVSIGDWTGTSGVSIFAYQINTSGMFKIEGKSNSEDLDTNRVYRYSSISLAADCQIAVLRSAFQNNPAIIKCQGNCDLSDGYIDSYGNGANDRLIAPFGGSTFNHGEFGALQVGNVALLYGVFVGGLGAVGGNAGLGSGGPGGCGGGGVVLAVGGNLDVTDCNIDIQGEFGWHGEATATGTPAGGGGGGGGTAVIFYAGTLTGTQTFITDGGEGGSSGAGVSTSSPSGVAYEGGGSKNPGIDTAGSQVGGFGGEGAAIISKYF